MVKFFYKGGGYFKLFYNSVSNVRHSLTISRLNVQGSEKWMTFLI